MNFDINNNENLPRDFNIPLVYDENSDIDD